MRGRTVGSFVFVAILTFTPDACRHRKPVPSPPALVCIDFQPPAFVTSTKYGAPAGQNPGDLAFTANGIPVHVWELLVPNPSHPTTFDRAYIDATPLLLSAVDKASGPITSIWSLISVLWAFQPLR